jgi:predicted dehydrogenase
MSQLNRRRFLEDSILAAAVTATAGGLTSQVAMAKEPEASSSPNEKLAVAIIGVKGRGGDHIGGMSGRKDVEITHICDADEDVGQGRCNEIEKKTGRRPEFVRDMRQLFDNDSIDMVTTATPNHWHSLCSIWAMQAGKDVYVEKPVSHNVWEGRKMVEAARKYNRICQTGTQCRSQSGMRDAMKFVQEGGIGEIKIARGLCYKGRGPIGNKGKYEPPKSVDFNLWTGPAEMQELTRPKMHYDWHWVWNTGNGDLGNQGIHQMDLARWGLNKSGMPKSVASYGGRIGYQDAGETANTQVCLFDYDDALLVFEVRGLKTDALRGAKVGVIFEGTEGYVVMTSYSSGVALDKSGKQIKKFGGGGNHYSNFLDAVRSRKVEDLNADIEEGHLSSALCHLGNISLRLGETTSVAEARERMKDEPMVAKTQETLDRFCEHVQNNGLKLEATEILCGPTLKLAGEEFTGNLADKANPMLTREYRAPFVVPKNV